MSLRPTQPGDLPTGGGLAPVPVATQLGFATDVQPDNVNLASWKGVRTHPNRNDLRSTVRPYDQLPQNSGAIVLLEEASRDEQIGQQYAQPSFLVPGPRRLEPTTYRGD